MEQGSDDRRHESLPDCADFADVPTTQTKRPSAAGFKDSDDEHSSDIERGNEKSQLNAETFSRLM
jgi:hypothetical protein